MEDRKLAAIVFTDIVGYTRRMETDEENTMKLLARQRELVFPLVKKYGGEVIKEIGDGLMMMFGSAERAVRFAMDVQDALKDEELTIRAGIHIGDVIFKGGDVFGSAVNIAARIEPLAMPGGISISEDVRNQVRNHSDILTSSIGKKELKGVNEAIEIYRIGPVETAGTSASTSILKDLWQRRVFQITGIYLVVSFLIRMIMGVIVDQYMLSPHLVNLTWFILMSLIPSAILIAYFHGRKGVTKWTKVELIGMPLNVIVAVTILVIVFRGKDLGAITTTLTVENEEGEKIEKLVVKNEFRKNLLIYNLKNNSGDAALDYLRYGIPAMTEYDLSQDLFITPEHAMKFYDRMVEAGFEDGVGLPVTLMQRFAEQRHMNYFLSGEFNREQESYVLDVKLWDTELTRLISEIRIQEENPFTLVDRLSVELKKAMGLPESHINSTVDLPVSEIFTASDKALFNFSLSLKEEALHNWPGNVHFLEEAIREDDGFALAYMTIALSHFQNNDFNAATVALDRAMELLYKLPERLQFVVKYINYVLGQQPEKAMNVVRMWVDLYPDDLMAHETMAQRYTVRSMYAEAIQEYKEIIRLDPEQYDAYSALGGYYLQIGDFDSSLAYYQRYARLLPEQARPFRRLGMYYSVTGDLDRSLENYEKALLLADMNEEVPIMISLANVLTHSGQFDLALEQYEEALHNAKSARDSGSVYDGLEMYYHIKGQMKRSLACFESKLAKFRTFLAPKDLMVFQAFNIMPYVDAGETEKAFGILESITEELPPPIDKVVPFGYMFIYAETGDPEKALEAAAGAEELIKGFGEEMLMAQIYESMGKVNELRGNYREAIEEYYKYLELDARDFTIYGSIARCHRHLKEFKKAEEAINTSLQHRPFDPLLTYEAALLNFDMGEDEQGLKYLQQTVDIWKDADPGYTKAATAREKLDSMQGDAF